MGISRKRWLVATLALAAFAQTLAFYAYLRDDPGNYNGAGALGDQVAYIALGEQIARGSWQGAVHYMPGFPALLAVCQLVFGDPRLGIALVQGLAYAGLTLGAAQLASAAFGERAGPWAAGLVALNPALGSYAAQALTEFMTGVVLFAAVAALARRSPRPGRRDLVVVGALVAAAGYLRSEYLALALVFALVVFAVARATASPGRAAREAMVVVAVAAAGIAPWVARNALVTGRPALYNESPFSNLILMGTWFRVFDEQTFSRLQRIETAPGPREQALEQARTVGPRPELSARYMEQARGPYERPLGETLSLAAGNIRLNLPQYLRNHLLLAPVLIWGGHTPVRQADAAAVPSAARWGFWALQLALVLAATWEAARLVRRPEGRALGLAFLGVAGFLTLLHVLIAVDERFTTPALPLVGTLAGGYLASARRAAVEGWPARAPAQRLG